MLSGHGGALFFSSCQQRAPCQISCPTKKSSRALMNCGHRILSEQLWGAADDRQMMGEVSGHVIALQGLHVAATDHARGEGPRGVKEQLVDQRCLPAQDHGHEGMGIVVQLGEGMQLGENIQAKHVRLIDEQERDLFPAGDLGEKSADKGQHFGSGIGGRRITEKETDLSQQLQKAARGGDQRQEAVLGGVQRRGSRAQ